MEKLPDEIVVDILSRLSLKSLFQCRGVCTAWRSIILRDPYFANVHLARASRVNVPCVVYRYFYSTCGPRKLYLFNFNSNDGQDHTPNIESKDQIALCFNPGINFGTVLSCNGLLCLCDRFSNNPIYVCNPVTRDLVALPQWPDQCKDHEFLPGFGFDALNKEYKVIRIMYSKERQHGVSHLMAEVYTLGSDAWRSIGSHRCRVISERQSFYHQNFSGPINIHGTLHWMIKLNFNPSTNLEIVAWDVSDEKFRVVPLPEEFFPKKDSRSMSLTEIGKCLSILDPDREFKSMDIWIMKDYNVKESWTKEVRENNPWWFMEQSLIKEASFQRRYKPLNRHSNTDISVKALYSCEERRFREVFNEHFFRSGRSKRGSTMNIATHVGSFISVNGNSWPDGVRPNGVAAGYIQSAKRKRR